MNIYLGDGSKIKQRIRSQHCSGNVEGSSLRKHIAKAIGYQLVAQPRPSGSNRVRLNLPNPQIGEQSITDYLRAGQWKYVICPSGIKARDFQFYAIQNIHPKPLLNTNQGNWDRNNLHIYQDLLNQLINCPLHDFNETENIPNESGVYLFIHDNKPI